MLGFVTTKKQISMLLMVILLAMVLFAVILWQAGKAAAETDQLPMAETAADRVDFLHRLGYTVDSSVPEQEKQIEIPHVFSEVYASYQALQQKAGYDLLPFAGKTVTLYTLHLQDATRTDVYAHLMVYRGRLIGGDIMALSVSDGYLRPLFKENE